MKRSAEIMQYQSDRLSYWLCVLSIIANAVYFVGIYANKDVAADVTTGADILLNIIFMMITFLSSEKLKGYQKRWNICIAAIGVVQILRVWWLPMHFNRLGMLTGGIFTVSVVSLLVSGVLLLLAGINSSINIRLLSRYVDGDRVGE